MKNHFLIYLAYLHSLYSKRKNFWYFYLQKFAYSMKKLYFCGDFREFYNKLIITLMKKYCLFILAALAFAACNTNNPAKPYEGTWEPQEGYFKYIIFENGDIYSPIYSTFYKKVKISSDQMIAFDSESKEYVYNYKFLRDSVIELEATFQPEGTLPARFVETRMYFDSAKYLIIEDFCVTIFSQYAPVKLKKK